MSVWFWVWQIGLHPLGVERSKIWFSKNAYIHPFCRWQMIYDCDITETLHMPPFQSLDSPERHVIWFFHFFICYIYIQLFVQKTCWRNLWIGISGHIKTINHSSFWKEQGCFHFDKKTSLYSTATRSILWLSLNVSSVDSHKRFTNTGVYFIFLRGWGWKMGRKPTACLLNKYQ